LEEKNIELIVCVNVDGKSFSLLEMVFMISDFAILADLLSSVLKRAVEIKTNV